MKEAPTINRIINAVAQQLATKYQDINLCTQYAWWALQAITHTKKADLIMQQSLDLTSEQQETLAQWIKQQVQDNIPLAYLIGSVPFLSSEILVQPPTLIPRPETEEWCARLIDQLKKLGTQKLRILDLCTGSGCIAISLAKELPHAKVYATDICDTALALAQKNAEYNHINSITFLASDLFQDIPSSLTFDLIISNPPYISWNEWRDLDPSVKDWEDNKALIASENGLGILRQVIQQAPIFIAPHPALTQHDIPQLIVEIGHLQADEVQKLFEKEGFSNVRVEKDLQGKNRIVSGCVNEKPQS
jgi:release factor glutamine methyltransferase